MSKQFYFDALIMENVLSFCGNANKKVQPILTTGVYVVKKPQVIKKYNVIQIDDKWLHIKSEWKKGIQSVKKVKNKDPTQCESLGFSGFNKLECLFTEEEWNEEMKWRRHNGMSIPYRIYNLECGRDRMEPPLEILVATQESCELEHFVLWRQIQERVAFEKVYPYIQEVERIRNLRFQPQPNTQFGLNTLEQRVQIQQIKEIFKDLFDAHKEAEQARTRAVKLLKILKAEMK